MLPDRATILAYLTILSGSAGRLAISLVYFLIVANTLTLGEFGLFATASATGLILSRMLAFGFISPLYRVATVKPRLIGAYLSGFSVLAVLSLPLIAAAAAGAWHVLFAGRLAALPFAVIILAEVVGWRLVEVVAIVNNGLRRFRQAATLVVIGSALRTLAALAFAGFGQANLEIWVLAYCGATMASALIAFTVFLPRVRWRFVRRLYPRRMADAVFAGTADIVFYIQSELDKLLVLGLAGERTAGLYAIALRVIDLTAMPVRSFNQMLVQKIMQERGIGGLKRLAGYEIGIALISVAGLAAVILALKPFPHLLGRNVSEAAYLFSPMLLVPAFRNLVEYHAELLYARERTGARITLLCLLTALKAGLITIVMTQLSADGSWAFWMNGVFAAVYLASAAFTYRLLAQARPGARTGGGSARAAGR
ncbi:lipopolysaccharide biosynthesis protein [Bosea sp. (in: a-proteobacteria)]|uniref:lipopolysaccharide biosynthesis protein n=1 Tax=Bosea sp. (in: a-proteobacteria) TaxID=1871050 RepID=UPI0026064998|nr:lipopolysaccharide biosynthesis protein [Bosea sp. (in: a-proteobacteria)]MCO5090461.1 lipopolysaccharide biosynthesis protein [Bosea sp. (in: a-proteobacteria)]